MRGVEYTTIMNKEFWEEAKLHDPYEKCKHPIEEEENENNITCECEIFVLSHLMNIAINEISHVVIRVCVLMLLNSIL